MKIPDVAIELCPPYASYTLDLHPPQALVYATARHAHVHWNSPVIKAVYQLLWKMEKIQQSGILFHYEI